MTEHIISRCKDCKRQSIAYSITCPVCSGDMEPIEHIPTLQGVVDYLGAQAINGIGQFDAYWRTWYGNGFSLAFDIKSKERL